MHNNPYPQYYRLNGDQRAMAFLCGEGPLPPRRPQDLAMAHFTAAMNNGAFENPGSGIARWFIHQLPNDKVPTPSNPSLHGRESFFNRVEVGRVSRKVKQVHAAKWHSSKLKSRKVMILTGLLPFPLSFQSGEYLRYPQQAPGFVGERGSCYLTEYRRIFENLWLVQDRVIISRCRTLSNKMAGNGITN